MEKSVLDYVITSQNLVSSVNSLKIDETKEFTPWRSLKCGKRKRYSDHNAIIVHMSINKHSKKDRGKKKLVWNFNDPSGWEKYHRITSSDRSLLRCWHNNNDPEMNYGIWSKKVNVNVNVIQFHTALSITLGMKSQMRGVSMKNIGGNSFIG